MIQATIVPVTPFQQNCSILWCERTRKAAVVDPGGDIDRILAAVAELGVPVEGPQEEDRFWIEGMPQQSKMFGFPDVESFEPERWLHDGDTVTVGEETLKVIHTPGHTPGHVVFVHEGARLAIVGDVLFAGSIGRTDFPRGDHQTLIRSIREKLFPLGDDITFIPGHGPTSTFGEERDSNPFVGAYG